MRTRGAHAGSCPAHLQPALEGIPYQDAVLAWSPRDIAVSVCLALQAAVARGEEHVDHDVVQVRGGAGDPLGDDEDAQVAEEGVQEDHLGDELAPDGQAVAVVAHVEPGQDDAHVHLEHACRAPAVLCIDAQTRWARAGKVHAHGNKGRAQHIRMQCLGGLNMPS